MTTRIPRIPGIDFDAVGTQFGYLGVEYSNNEYDAAVIPSPIAVISGSPGPTVLLTAGTHGDEYEGQLLLHELIRDLSADDVTGRLIVLPALNLLAVRESSRVSTADGANLNRALPGDPVGTPTQQIASILSGELIPMADFLLDIHSGGSTSEYLPSAFVYAGPTPERWAQKAAAVEALGLPDAIVVKPMLKPGSLSGAGDLAGIPTISTELGGGGTVSVPALTRARAGLRRLLRHWGVLRSAEPHGESGGPERIRWLGLGPGSEIVSSMAGLFEPCVVLGQAVQAGDVVAKVWSIEELDRPARVFVAAVTGTVAVVRRPTKVDVGTALVSIAVDHVPVASPSSVSEKHPF